jgi:Fic family protein
MTSKLFAALGFTWEKGALPAEPPACGVERAAFRFQRMLPEFVWDAGVLEGNPFTFPEVKTLMDGVTVGGRRLSDQEQILNLAAAARQLLALVKSGEFRLDKATFTGLHALTARNEALEWGVFRGEGREPRYTPDVALGEKGRYTPPATEPGAPALNRIFREALPELQTLPPFERALAFFLFGALWQFFFDGNKRTSRFMMNGILMTHGLDAISVPAARAREFNEKMVRFYCEKNGTEMMAFLASCHPEV